MIDFDADSAAILAVLRRSGVATAQELARAIGRSQPSVSRRVRALSPQIAVLGRGRRTRYGLAAPILGLPPQLPVRWIDATGVAEAVGTLQFIAGDWTYLEVDRAAVLTQGRLPWMLAPLRLQGFLGRTRAAALASLGFDADPERWSLAELLHVNARYLRSPAGAIIIGEPEGTQSSELSNLVPADLRRRSIAYERLCEDVAQTLPAGSSAAGKQAKFLAEVDAPDGPHVLVKFAPPRESPFGERWHDLLHAESIALAVLADEGIPVATTRVLATTRRTLLESERFDRIGRRGARHVVALDAIHDAFVAGPRAHWAASADALATARRLSVEDAARIRLARAFGLLIGNTDMHFGNLSFFVDRVDVARGRIRLAPVYDMLPMRWRPDPASGALDDLPFEPPPVEPRAARMASTFWDAVARHAEHSRRFRALARAMRDRVAVAATSRP